MLTNLNFAYGRPKSSGQFKKSPDDFCVEENLGYELSGEGEHLFIFIEKKQLNTEEMVKIISKSLGLPMKLISYAGLKDKQAITKQWFSIHLPGVVNPNLNSINQDNHHVLKSVRHHKKLKIGALKENHFSIRIQNARLDKDELIERIETIKALGVPNYFGSQRFGRNGGNLERAQEVLIENKKIKNRHLRGIYYSAARSFLFNQILSLRVKESSWNSPLPGDLMMLAGSNSVFQVDKANEALFSRIDEHDISPAAALWGEGEERLFGDALHIQNRALEPWQDWCRGLEHHGLQKSYRQMILWPTNLNLFGNVLSFTLPKGTFATTVIRELVLTDPE